MQIKYYILRLFAAFSKILFHFYALLGVFDKDIRAQYRIQKNVRLIIDSHSTDKQKRRVVFFCSSTGEYLQIKTLIDKFIDADWSVHLFFHSKSGYGFLKNRRTKFSYSYAPIDSHTNWNQIFNHINPRIIIINKHEIWPGFLSAAYGSGIPLILLNLFLPKKSNSVKTFFYNFFTEIYCVNQLSIDNLPDTLKARARLVSDTKYDYVIDRKAHYRTLVEFRDNRMTLVAGSVWQKDLDMILKSDYLKDNNYLTIICPHDLKLVKLIHGHLNKRSWRFKEINENNWADLVDTKELDAIIINRMGVLFDLYSIASFAYVGGGLHHKVHNVLEPAIFDVPVAFGPSIGGAHEALALIEDNEECKIVNNSKEFYSWIMNRNSSHSQSTKIATTLCKRGGASIQIYQNLEKL